MIVQDLQQDVIKAQKEKDILRLSVLRYLLSQMKNKEIDLRPEGVEFSDEHAVQVMKKQIKQRNQTIENARQANRNDIIEKETVELELLEDYYNRYSGQ